MKKNIAIIIDSLAGGGAEKVVITLASYLSDNGHKVTLFVLRRVCQYKVPENINLVFPFGDESPTLRSWFNRQKLARKLEDAVKQQESLLAPFDLTLVNLYESYKLASACAFTNAYYVMHNSFKQELKREKRMGPIKYLYMKSILKMLSGKNLIGVSRGVSDELSKASLFRPKTIKHIYNPFDIESITRLSMQTQQVNVTDKYIIHVGRAAKAKRHDVLFKALKNVDDTYKLVCLAVNTKKLKKLAIKYGVADRVILPGFTENPYAWINKAELMVLSSDFEGLSMVLIEALICKTKVVASDCDFGPNEILTGNLSQFLVPKNDPLALSNAINRAIDYQLLEQDFDILQQVEIKKVAEQYLALS